MIRDITSVNCKKLRISTFSPTNKLKPNVLKPKSDKPSSLTVTTHYSSNVNPNSSKSIRFTSPSFRVGL